MQVLCPGNSFSPFAASEMRGWQQLKAYKQLSASGLQVAVQPRPNRNNVHKSQPLANGSCNTDVTLKGGQLPEEH